MKRLLAARMKALLANFRPGHPGRFFVCGTITVVLEDPFSRHLDYCSLANAISAAVWLVASRDSSGASLPAGSILDALRNEDMTAAETRSVTQMSIEALPEPGVIDAAQTPGHSADGDDHGYWNNPPRRRRMVAKKASITGDFFEGAETWCSSSFRTGA